MKENFVDVKVGWMMRWPLKRIDTFSLLRNSFRFLQREIFRIFFSHFHKNCDILHVCLSSKDMAISIFSRADRIFVSFSHFRLFLVAESRLLVTRREKLNVKCEIMHMKETFHVHEYVASEHRISINYLNKFALISQQFHFDYHEWVERVSIFS